MCKACLTGKEDSRIRGPGLVGGSQSSVEGGTVGRVDVGGGLQIDGDGDCAGSGEQPVLDIVEAGGEGCAGGVPVKVGLIHDLPACTILAFWPKRDYLRVNFKGLTVCILLFWSHLVKEGLVSTYTSIQELHQEGE